MPRKQEKVDEILSILEKKGGLYPKQVALYTGINHSTVKSYLRELEKRGEVEDVAGLYSVVEGTHRDVNPPKVQNFVLSIALPSTIAVHHAEEDFDLGFCKMHFVVGEKNHKVTGHVSADPPIGIETAFTVGLLFAEKVEKAVGWKPDQGIIFLKTVEVNWDDYGVRLDGVNAITLRTIGAEEKLYNKKHALRHEHRILCPMTLETLLGIVDKGATTGYIFKQVSELRSDIDNMMKANKKMSNGLLRLTHFTQEIAENAAKSNKVMVK